MSNAKHDTVSEIVAEMLEFADADSQSMGRDVLRRRIQHFARRIEAAAKREREATPEKSSVVANAAAMREALEKVRFYLPYFLQYMRLRREDEKAGGYYESILEVISAALSAPPRNCDVGTAEEQIKRHTKWCRSDKCSPEIPCSVCFAKWSQMPYEEGGAK